jgi:hypothetical protein
VETPALAKSFTLSATFFDESAIRLRVTDPLSGAIKSPATNPAAAPTTPAVKIFLASDMMKY